MRMYLKVFATSFENEFIYRTNFLLWRLRNVLRFLMVYFLWRGVYGSNTSVFGYGEGQMLTYVFLILIVQSMVLASPSGEFIGSEISSGDLSNYLVKPLSYLKYWFTRDLASKALNMSFAAVELIILVFILKPQITFPGNLTDLLMFAISCLLAAVLYFFVNAATRLVAFWTPEYTWGVSFLVLVFVETMAGGLYPLDILPETIQNALQFTPFPYLIYFPIAIFVGKIQGWDTIRILGQSLAWCGLAYLCVRLIWERGLKIYSAEGR